MHVKCNLTELTTRSTCFNLLASGVCEMRMYQDPSCSGTCVHLSVVQCIQGSAIFVCLPTFSMLYSAWAYHKCCDSVYKWFLSSPFSTDVLIVTVSAFFPATWGSQLGCQDFPAKQEAGCPQWKLLGIIGTQPPLSNTVVDFILRPLLKLPVAAFLSHVHCIASARNTQAVNLQPVEHGSLHKILHNDTSLAVQTIKDQPFYLLRHNIVME